MENNKAILEKANAAIRTGDNEGFLSHCTEDTKWVFVGDRTLEGKEAVREWMLEAYTEPPQFIVENLIGDGDFVTAIGEITLKDENGEAARHLYCDIWRFREDKMAELKAFVIKA
ncbi:nuclear transport factor 2 family protein [Adhaeribacter radiodurans]|nr:nuclear transport factor 2 family protein [Adhaeribacter radiodurans]